ncbi:MAG TPA: FIST N-terminal domain-containing protein [Acidimicrobiales bacterium]|nr:FIST N-terminal domain-containing protein [Acidimicrobiales bacterium]
MSGRPFAAALSQHPDAAVATGDVVGRVLEALGDGDGDGPPDLALVFVTPIHARVLGDIVATVRATLAPGALLGCAAVSVVGGEREVERGPAISLWAGRTGAVTPFHLDVAPSPDGLTFTGWPDTIPDDASALLLIPDPFSFPTEDLLRRLEEDRPGMPVVGGMASAARAPGGNRLVIDDRVVSAGAVGAFLGPDVQVTTVVSQGCRPVGSPFVVTRAEQNIVYELAGRTAIERLQEVAAELTDEDRELLSELVQIGRVIDENQLDFGPGDFLVRTVVGADPSSGALRVGDVVEVGSTAQFQVRDAASADQDLRRMVDGQSAQAALVFTCNGRGTHLFSEPHHDATVVSESLGGAPVAGMFCAGELGPIGGHNFMHGFTASVVLLSVEDRPGA